MGLPSPLFEKLCTYPPTWVTQVFCREGTEVLIPLNPNGGNPLVGSSLLLNKPNEISVGIGISLSSKF